MDKMRERFEALLREEAEVSGMDAPNFQLSPCVLDDGAVIYVSDMTQACWWTFRMAWKASRESLVVTLPQRWSVDGFESGWVADPDGANLDYSETVKAIEAAGLKVQP